MRFFEFFLLSKIMRLFIKANLAEFKGCKLILYTLQRKKYTVSIIKEKVKIEKIYFADRGCF